MKQSKRTKPRGRMIPVTVVLDEEDRVELYHMLRNRGGSDLKRKLTAALDELSRAAGVREPYIAHMLHDLED